MKRKFICTTSLYNYKKPYCRWAKIDRNGWIDGETPIEDCGAFMILDEEISQDSADRIFMALWGAAEGEEPKVGDHEETGDFWTDYRNSHLLNEKEYSIYKELTQ